MAYKTLYCLSIFVNEILHTFDECVFESEETNNVLIDLKLDPNLKENKNFQWQKLDSQHS